MLFTLLTRVGRLENIYFVGYKYACLPFHYHTTYTHQPTPNSCFHVRLLLTTHPKLMRRRDELVSLLRRRTWWHPIADAWLAAADLCNTGPSAKAAAARMQALVDLTATTDYMPSSLPIPIVTIPTVYLINSPSTAKHYIGSTLDIRRRLRQHRSAAKYIAGALNTHRETDWQLRCYVHGFADTDKGLLQARYFERCWQKFPCTPDRSIHHTVDIGCFLVAQRQTDGLILFIESDNKHGCLGCHGDYSLYIVL